MSHQGKAAGKGPKRDRKPKPKNGSKPGDAKLAGDLKKRVGAMIDALVNEDLEAANETFEHMLTRACDLFRRKQAMEGTKSETRDLIGEVMFTRLRRAFREFLSSDDAASEIKCAEWAMGLLYSGTALQEFAAAIDRAMLETSRPMDYSFAGRADFISVEEVLQLLGSGNYTGMLGIEKDDNRLDIYLHKGRIVFLDPHHLIRRILPTDDTMNYREISEDLLRKAEALHAKKSLPLIMGLVELNLFKPKEIPELVRTFGLEVLFEFLRDAGACSFFYRKSEDLPDFAKKYRLNLAVTPILLEGSRQMDDWISMLKVFPDPTAPVEPVPDMFARINSLDLDVVEIRLLAMINGETSPKALAPAIGLPLVDVYQTLIGFARDGVLVAPGGLEALHEISFSVEESMERAFEALDANDDQLARASALDAALGSGEPGGGDDAADHADRADHADEVDDADGILARLGVGKRTRKDS